jgi:alkaline phosphatase D
MNRRHFLQSLASLAGFGLYSSIGNARLPLPERPFRIAFGSCAQQWKQQPIWDAIIARRPNLFIFTGNAIYADTDGKSELTVTESSLAAEWDRLRDTPGYQKATEKFPVIASWSNHDYGSREGGREFLLREESKKIFLDFFEEPSDSSRWQHEGIYHNIEFRNGLQIILLDTQSFRSALKPGPGMKVGKANLDINGNYLPDPAGSLLGETQWSWLEQVLKRPAQVRLLVSGKQIIPDQKARDEWGNYPNERNRLFRLIDNAKANNIVMLSGSVQFSELSSFTTTGNTKLTELTSSGLTHTNTSYAALPNSHRLKNSSTELNFGLIELMQHGTETVVNLSIEGINGETLLEHSLVFD